MSDLAADHDEPRGRSTTIAVVLAVVFLAVLGASVGVVLGNLQGGNNGGSVADQSPEPPEPSAGASDTATPDPGKTGGTSTRTRGASPGTSYPPTRKDDCPLQTDQAAHTDLSVKLYIKTRSSEVWICQGGGRFFYQGHLRGRSFTAATSDNSLFLTDPRLESGVWAAVNGSTTYFVSTQRLRVTKNGSEINNEPVDEFYEG